MDGSGGDVETVQPTPHAGRKHTDLMKKILTHWTLAFVTLAVLMMWGLKDPFVKETARLKSFDLIQKYDTPTMSEDVVICLLYTSPSPRDYAASRMPSSA